MSDIESAAVVGGKPQATGITAKVLAIVELVLNVFIIVCGVVYMVNAHNFTSWVVSVFIIVFGLLGLFNIIGMWVTSLQQYWLFYMTWLGRGIWLVFIGCLVYGGAKTFLELSGILVLIYAGMCIVAQFVAPFAPPAGLVQSLK
ncbi:MAG: hypothetical protein MHM6MM_008617 [Cercozoa sp. M6MM]